MKVVMAIAALLLVLSSGPGDVPVQNREMGTPPDVAGALEGARGLIDALTTDDPSLAADFFFPAEAFDLVKDIPVPGRYHKKLVAWYQEDIHAESKRFRSGTWSLDKVELGACQWKDIGTEGNKLPYWSCRRNMVTVRDGEKTRRFEIRVLINWGERWYVTHLGPVRQQ